jgi:hypothetical protein
MFPRGTRGLNAAERVFDFTKTSSDAQIAALWTMHRIFGSPSLNGVMQDALSAKDPAVLRNALQLVANGAGDAINQKNEFTLTHTP